MTLNAPAVLASSSSASDLAAYATASVNPAAGALVTVLVLSGKASNLAATPTSVTHPSIGPLTKVGEAQVPNNNVRISLWAGVGTGTAGAFTITHAAAQDNCAWHIISQTSDIGTPTVAQFATLSTALTGNQGASLPAAAAAGSTVIGGMVINAASSVVPTYGSGFAVLGTRQTITSPTVQLMSEYDATSPAQQALFGFSTNAAGKAFITYEIADAVPPPDGPEATWWTGSAEVPATLTWWTGSAEVPVTSIELHP